jgi:membrane associated rhomboid family serine protease
MENEFAPVEVIDPRADVRRGYRARSRAWATWSIFGTTVAVFLLQLHRVHEDGNDAIGNTLAFSPEAWADGRYWTLITYAWAHAVALFGRADLFWLHIVGNMIPLVCLGPALEDFLGSGKFLLLYLGGAVVSALCWFVFNPGSQEGIIGASGAIFALIAAAGTASPGSRVVVYLFFVLPIRMSLRVLALVVCGTEVVQIFFNWMPEVAHSAHLGGAAFGFLFVMADRWLMTRRRFT